MNETNEQRFERIRRDFGPALYRVVKSYARPGADQEDLAQEVSIALWRALPSFREECSERTFVYRIAHNRGLNHLFRRKTVESDPPDVADARPNPESEAASRERIEQLFAGIRTLPVGHRQVLTLALEEIPHSEIATILGISVENVAVRLGRARAALRVEMTKEQS